MRNFKLAMTIFALVSGPALAAEPYIGAWSGNPLNCSATAETQSRTVYVLRKNSLSLPAFGCERASYHRSSRGWSITASQCYGSPGASGSLGPEI